MIYLATALFSLTPTFAKEPKNIAQFHLPKNIINNAGNLIVQAVFNEKTDQVVICRSVLFESIDDKLSNTLAQHDGIVIVE